MLRMMITQFGYLQKDLHYHTLFLGDGLSYAEHNEQAFKEQVWTRPAL